MQEDGGENNGVVGLIAALYKAYIISQNAGVNIAIVFMLCPV